MIYSVSKQDLGQEIWRKPGKKWEKLRKTTYTSLMVLDSPWKRDSGGIHLTGRRAFVKQKNKWTIINKNMRKCKELPDQNRKKKKINVFFIALQMYVTLPVMSARKCHPLHHAQVQSQKFCTLGSRQRECYEQPNHGGRPKKKTNKQIRRNECYELTQTELD